MNYAYLKTYKQEAINISIVFTKYLLHIQVHTSFVEPV